MIPPEAVYLFQVSQPWFYQLQMHLFKQVQLYFNMSATVYQIFHFGDEMKLYDHLNGGLLNWYTVALQVYMKLECSNNIHP